MFVSEVEIDKLLMNFVCFPVQHKFPIIDFSNYQKYFSIAIYYKIDQQFYHPNIEN